METKYKIVNIKKYSIAELYNFRAKAMLAQGNGPEFSQMLDNRISMLKGELIKRGESI